MEVVLDVQNLSKTFQVGLFQKRQVLEQVSFKIKKRTVVGFIGANGSGKTTTLKCLFKFVFPDSGLIHYFGQPEFNDKIKNQIGYVTERPYLPDFMTIEEFLNFHWKLGGRNQKDFKDRFHSVIQQVRLTKALGKPLRTFSKGMQQRAAIAQALLLSPEFLIFDEPMTGLDPDGRLIVKKIIKDEKEKGTTILFSSHLLNDMDELCTDILMIHSGKILFSGALSEFSNSSKGVESSYANLLKQEDEG